MSRIRMFTDTTKWCPQCKEFKPNSDFTKNKKKISGLSNLCREHANKAVADHYDKNPRSYTPEQMAHNKEKATKWNAENKDKRRKQKCNSPEYLRQIRYGLTPEQYKTMWDEQNGLCKIPSCKNPIQFVDHNHETNEVRALLCRQCNTAIGHFRENPELMREAALYVEKFKNGGGIPIVIKKAKGN